MSLLKQPTQTRGDLIARVVNNIRNRSIASADTLKSCVVDSANLVWRNPLDLTPEEVVAGFGTDAADLFAKSKQSTEFLVAIGVMTPEEAAALRPTGYSYAINPDGTVTITKQ